MAVKRWFRVFGLVSITLMLAMHALEAQSGDTAAIQKKLNEKFKLTTTTSDGAAIAAAGDMVAIRQSGLVLFSVTTPIQPTNNYKAGKIVQGFGTGMQMADKRTLKRKFEPGEKCWITQVVVQDDGVSFSLYSDPYNDMRYYGTLKIPFADKKNVPSVDAAMALVAEVLEVTAKNNQTSPNTSDSVGTTQAQPQSQSLTQEQDWKAIVTRKLAQYHLSHVSSDKMTLDVTGTKITLKKDGLGVGAYKMSPSSNAYYQGTFTHELPTLFRHEVERGTSRVLSAGEKIWVTKAGFASKDGGVELEVVSDPYTTTNEYGGTQLRYWGIIQFLVPKGTTPNGAALVAAMDEVLQPEDSSKGGFCSALVKMVSTPTVDIQDTTILPGASLAQRQYAKSDSVYHTESFELFGDKNEEIHNSIRACLPDYKVEASLHKEEGFEWNSTLHGFDAPFDILVQTTSYIKNNNRTIVVVGISRAENDTQRRLDFAKIAFIETASDTCGWSISDEQLKYLNKYRIGGLEFEQELGLARRHIEQVGKLDFCDDEKEKAKYDRLVKTLWPLGLVGKP